jgi:Zn-dependent peptidase ImmA (M78 family)/DNA-binding transcriptional regulator YiaG
VGVTESNLGNKQSMDRFTDLEEQLSSQLGGRLRRAREEMQLSQKELGEALGYGPGMISAFENGQRRMKIEDLTRACIVLNRPPEYFLGEAALPASEPVGLSLRADLAALPSDELTNSMMELLDGIEADLPFGGSLVDLRELRPELAARETLRIAGVHEPPVKVADVCEALAVPIYKRPLPNSLSAAVMTLGEDTFAIGVNKGHPTRRQRFSVAHELGHAVLRHRASFYLEYAEDVWEPPDHSYEVEREANAFAAALLMDQRWVREDFASGIRDVDTLAKRYEVSSAAMGFRLSNLGLI